MFVERKQIIESARNEIFTKVLSEEDNKTQHVAQRALNNSDAVAQLKSNLADYRRQFKFNFIARIYLFFADRHEISKLNRQIQAVKGLASSSSVSQGEEEASESSASSGKSVVFNEETNAGPLNGLKARASMPRTGNISPKEIINFMDAVIARRDRFEAVLPQIQIFAEGTKAQGRGFEFQYNALEALIYLCCFHKGDLKAFNNCFALADKRLVFRDLANDIAVKAIGIAEREGFSPDNIEAFKIALKNTIRERNESYDDVLKPHEFYDRFAKGNITVLNLPNAKRNNMEAVGKIWENPRTFTFRRYTDEQLDSLDQFIDQLFALKEVGAILQLLVEKE